MDMPGHSDGIGHTTTASAGHLQIGAVVSLLRTSRRQCRGIEWDLCRANGGPEANPKLQGMQMNRYMAVTVFAMEGMESEAF